MKLKKKSTLIGAISVLAGVSVVSVGFASWVVSAGNTDTVNGSISVEEVNDQRHILTKIHEPSNLVVKYGVKSGAAASGQVLSYTGVTAFEHLTIGDTSSASDVFEYTIAHYDTAHLSITVAPSGDAYTWYRNNTTGAMVHPDSNPGVGYTKIQKDLGNEQYDDTLTAYEAAQVLGLVGELPAYEINFGSAATVNTNINVSTTTDTDTKVATVKFALEFKWGTHFTGYFDNDLSNNTGDIHNPYDFYNTPSYDTTAAKNLAAEDAVKSLTSLEQLLYGVNGAGVTYTVTIQTSHVA